MDEQRSVEAEQDRFEGILLTALSLSGAWVASTASRVVWVRLWSIALGTTAPDPTDPRTKLSHAVGFVGGMAALTAASKLLLQRFIASRAGQLKPSPKRVPTV